MPTLLDSPGQPVAFADDPIVSHSAQFGLARPIGTPARPDLPSPAGTRPWNLRCAQVMDGCSAPVPSWRYDHDLQLALTLDGRLITEIINSEPSADSVTDLDGDEGKSEDYIYDFCPDNPSSPA